MEKLLKETEEKKIHVLYYKVGANMQGLSRIMQQLKNLYGDRIIALPKDITKLEKDALSLQDLLNLRSTINLWIMDKLRAENENQLQPPDQRAGAVMHPNMQRPPVAQNMAPQRPTMQGPNNQVPTQGNGGNGRPYQPQNGPQRPPAPPTSGSNAVKPGVRMAGFVQGIEAPPLNIERK
jgi:hypothetical protein